MTHKDTPDADYYAYSGKRFSQNGLEIGAGQGMTLRDYFAGQTLANHTICTGVADGYELKSWFGGRCGITREEIIAKQAYIHADAMLEARK